MFLQKSISFGTWFLSREIIAKLAKQHNLKTHQSLPKLNAEIASLEQNRRRIQAQIDNSIDHLTQLPKGAASESLYKRLTQLEEERAQIDKQKEEVQSKKNKKDEKVIDVQALFSFLQMIHEALPKQEARIQKEILRLLIASIKPLSAYRIQVNY